MLPNKRKCYKKTIFRFQPFLAFFLAKKQSKLPLGVRPAPTAEGRTSTRTQTGFGFAETASQRRIGTSKERSRTLATTMQHEPTRHPSCPCPRVTDTGGPREDGARVPPARSRSIARPAVQRQAAPSRASHATCAAHARLILLSHSACSGRAQLVSSPRTPRPPRRRLPAAPPSPACSRGSPALPARPRRLSAARSAIPRSPRRGRAPSAWRPPPA